MSFYVVAEALHYIVCSAYPALGTMSLYVLPTLTLGTPCHRISVVPTLTLGAPCRCM